MKFQVKNKGSYFLGTTVARFWVSQVTGHLLTLATCHFFLTRWGGRHSTFFYKKKGSCLGLTLQARARAVALLGQTLGLAYQALQCLTWFVFKFYVYVGFYYKFYVFFYYKFILIKKFIKHNRVVMLDTINIQHFSYKILIQVNYIIYFNTSLLNKTICNKILVQEI